jgi:hypothetical protein
MGVSDRHVRRLLAAAKEPSERFREGELEQGPKQQKRDEAIWQACRVAHAILGLEEADDRDPTGVQRKAALAAMAHQFLHEVGQVSNVAGERSNLAGRHAVQFGFRF